MLEKPRPRRLEKEDRVRALARIDRMENAKVMARAGGRTGDVVGFECPIGVLETMGCSDYEPPTAWPEGAIA